jgi:ribosomal protein S18 acetylase RimI-like enzyme
MSEYTVTFRNQLAHTPCLPLLYRSYAELIENGYSMPTVPWTNKEPCLYMQNSNNEVHGAMVYSVELDTLWIIFSCIHSEHRGKGLHKQMWSELENYARNTLNCKRITSLVHVNNKAIINASAKVGMIPTWHRMLKVL